jgi:hypothetical protein
MPGEAVGFDAATMVAVFSGVTVSGDIPRGRLLLACQDHSC